MNGVWFIDLLSSLEYIYTVDIASHVPDLRSKNEHWAFSYSANTIYSPKCCQFISLLVKIMDVHLEVKHNLKAGRGKQLKGELLQ